MSTKPSYLLDTHALIWYQDAHPRLPERVITKIRNPDNRVLFSQVSLLEIAIKRKIGKLPDFTASLDTVHQQALDDGFEFLPLLNLHISNYLNVPLFEQHRDPFDRLLIGIAQAEGAIILTEDGNFSLYREFVEAAW